MKRRGFRVPDLSVTLDPHAAAPFYQQLYDELRRAILMGRLAPGAQLPATRVLAEQLGVSRNTVTNAFDQLIAEGYLESIVGSGTYVSSVLPDDLLGAYVPSSAPHRSSQERILSKRGAVLAATPVTIMSPHGRSKAFRTGLPALDQFPFDLWARLSARRWRQPPLELLGYGDPAGYKPLREAIAAYLRASRGVQCTPEEVIIVAGSQQALYLAVQVLLDPGDSVWVEDPGYIGARGALSSAGVELIPLPVDQEGLSVAAGIQRCASARMVYVTPSHQFPLGVTMSLPRRLALLEWAQRSGAWILEDDYDSEYRYASRPLPALQGLDNTGSTIYVGTFSKTLFPSLRIGYLVVPQHLAAAFVAARALLDRHSPALEQAVLADFIEQGHFVRHIRRMRALYAERQAYFIDAARRELKGLLTIAPPDAGMHVVGWLAEDLDDRKVTQRAADHGIDAPALSAYTLSVACPSGLLLGYAALSEPEIDDGLRRLGAALRQT